MVSDGDIGSIGESFEESLMPEMSGDGDNEARSVSFVSGNDRETEDHPKKKRHNRRHSLHQVQQLEDFYKECPHPDTHQRTALSRRLGLEPQKVKFWFQNRRTQMKTQMEHHENVMLKQDNCRLRAQNDGLRDAMRNPRCQTCDGEAASVDACYEQNQIRIENDQLRDEITRLYSLKHKFFDNPLSSSISNMVPSMGRNEFFGSSIMEPETGVVENEVQYGRPILTELALAAMDEFLKLSDQDSSVWVKGSNRETDKLDYSEYRRIFHPYTGRKRTGFVSEATRETNVVNITSLAVMETLMNSDLWVETFPSLIAWTVVVDVISDGIHGTKNGALQVMNAEFQVTLPLVPVRPIKFLRFCKQHSEGVWAVVDVSLNVNHDDSTLLACRRLPSGCLVQEVGNGCSKITWVEHCEYNENLIHPLFRPFVNVGLAFGARRWLASFQRQCESMQILASSRISTEDHSGFPTGSKKNILKLAQRMINNFLTGVSASSICKWDKLHLGDDVDEEDTQILVRKSIDYPGEPSGMVLSATKCVWLPVTREKIFAFLKDERLRSEWDFLSHVKPMQELLYISKSHCGRNCVQLLCDMATGVISSENAMVILKETWNDDSGSLLVSTPLDLTSAGKVINNGDSDSVAVLPSGFAIFPSGPSNSEIGCFLTVGFQILVNALSTAKISLESVQSVNNLISCTVHKIKASLQLV